MKKVLLFFTILCLSLTVATAQKKVWSDDKEAVTKVDTQQVTIGGVEYRKFVTVTYEPISAERLRDKYHEKKQQLSRLLEEEERQREQAQVQIKKLREELQAEKSFYKQTADKKKWKGDIDIPPDTQPDASVELERLREEFVNNPRKRPK